MAYPLQHIRSNTIRKVVTATDNGTFFNPTLRSNCIYLSGLSRRLSKNHPKNPDTLTFRVTRQRVLGIILNEDQETSSPRAFNELLVHLGV